MSACMLGFLIVFTFIIYSFIVLVSRFFSDAKLAYGIMLGMAINCAWFQLLAGLVLQTSEPLAKQFRDYGYWSDRMFQTFQATWVWCYMLVGEYIIVFFVFLFGRKFLGRAELAAPAGPPPAQAMNSYVDMGKGTQV
eukprot:CAMPEP_0202862590 /NCGR_PEP_ID=MMETSP1391-20130828/3576_1 /ASSEMBLY_ACC=CAM_ASM_000867 /TAXON_ID=1034604 /ORGANISM="Chlamydomonas leiostraca, Strain SAG 11-49" /LENGTH=136 /DNA_ID=CAMNT_0049542139 /DNA_START=262 /DNA_END=672 /DNA_ORIENTATION=+